MRHFSVGDSLQSTQGWRWTWFSNLIIVILWVCQRETSVAVTEAGRKEAFNFGCQSEKENESHWAQSGSVQSVGRSVFGGRVSLASYFYISLSFCLSVFDIQTNTKIDIKYAFPFFVVTSCPYFPCSLADFSCQSLSGLSFVYARHRVPGGPKVTLSHLALSA